MPTWEKYLINTTKGSTADALQINTWNFKCWQTSSGNRMLQYRRCKIRCLCDYVLIIYLFSSICLVQPVKMWQDICTVHVICPDCSSHEHHFIWLYSHLASVLFVFVFVFVLLIISWLNEECGMSHSQYIARLGLPFFFCSKKTNISVSHYLRNFISLHHLSWTENITFSIFIFFPR